MRGRAGLRVARLDELATPGTPAPAARFDAAPDPVDAARVPIAEFADAGATAEAPVATFGDDDAPPAADAGPGSAPVADLAAPGAPHSDQRSPLRTARLDDGRSDGGQRARGGRGSRRGPMQIVQPEPDPERAGSDDQQRRRGGGPRVERRARAEDTGANAATPPPARRPFGPKQIESDADPVVAAREICLRLLADRAHTRQELAQALRRRGVPDEAAGSVLERFDEVGLIDDAAFAAQFVRSRHNHKGLARRAIAMELRHKGVDGEVAEEALGEVDADSEYRRARELVDRKLRSLAVTTPEQRTVATRRLVGMLARKGYGAGTAYGVVREALIAHGTELDDLGTDLPED